MEWEKTNLDKNWGCLKFTGLSYIPVLEETNETNFILCILLNIVHNEKIFNSTNDDMLITRKY